MVDAGRLVGSGSVPPMAVRSGMTRGGAGSVPLSFVIPDGRAADGAAEPDPTRRFAVRDEVTA